MFVSKSVFWSRSPSEPIFYRWSRNQIFLPGANKKLYGAGAEEKMVRLRNTALLCVPVHIYIFSSCSLFSYSPSPLPYPNGGGGMTGLKCRIQAHVCIHFILVNGSCCNLTDTVSVQYVYCSAP